MNFSSYGVKKRKRAIMSKSSRYERRFFIIGFQIFLVIFVLVIIVAAGAGFGMMKGILDDAPDVNSISIKPKGFQTVIYDQDGNELETLSTTNSNRIYVYYDEIPKQMVNAFVAIEDERFWKHNGIDVRGIFRALYKDIAAGNFDEGASTITQQLIKNQVFDVGMNETTKLQKIERKVQEQYLAIELEKIYTKEQIIEYYLNTIYLGQGCNGIEAAAQRYFDKSIGDLTISEMAVIAGITKNPYGYDPIIFPESNNERRILVLDKMLELGYITEGEHDEAVEDDVYDRIKAVKQESDENFHYNSYYTDDLMRALCDDFMELFDMTESEAYNEIYTGGYSVYSVQDDEIQEIVDRIINDDSYYNETTAVSLEYTLTILDDDGETTYNYDTNTMLTYYRNLTENSKYNNIYGDEEKAREAAETYKEAMLEATGGTYVADEIKTQIQPQASISIIENLTGYVVAIGGGRGEKTENLGFDRATNAKRQPGSCFKVVAAFLPYVDTMGGLCSCFNDTAYQFVNGVNVRNWYGGYRGWSSVRDGIRDSMNIVAVQAITAVTPQVAFEYLLDEGFTTLVEKRVDSDGTVYSDIQQATALGGLTDGITNLEITAAYSGISNMGLYTKPVFYSQVYDHDGNLIIDYSNPINRQHRFCKETTAYQMIDAMKDVVTSGTGTRARLTTGMTCAGKTGTTSNQYDLWFCGITPYYSSSVWFGYDSNIALNTNMHKTMWRDINDAIVETKELDTSADWEVPTGLKKVTVCKKTGLLPSSGCPTSTDYCDEDNVPTKRCSGHMNTITLCDESHCLATNTCPSKTQYSVTTNDDGTITIDGATFEYDQSVFKTKCPLHPEVEDGIVISTSASEGGAISESVTVAAGSSVTVYITPDANHTIADVQVDGASVGAVGKYTIDNIQENHTITATFNAVETATEATTQATTEATTQATTQATTSANTYEVTTQTTTQATTQATTEATTQATEATTQATEATTQATEADTTGTEASGSDTSE